MTQIEVLQTLAVLRAAYPAFYSRTKDTDINATVDLWSEMFANDDVNIVKYALKELIATHSGFPPDIAAVKNKIREIVSAATNEPTDEDLWNILAKAASNGYYNAQKEFDNLPNVLKRYCGSPNKLRELACLDSHEFATVVHGQFLKQIGIMRDREEKARSMPDFVRVAVNETYKPLIGDSDMTSEQLNMARNEKFALLDSVPD